MILSLVEKHVTLRKQGAHYVGPCPKCGGSAQTTRFVVNVAKGFVQCYSCGLNADPVRFLREIEGKSCPDAHRTAGVECNATYCPAWDKCSHGRGDHQQRSSLTTPAPAAERKGAGFTAGIADTPADLWQQKAAKLVERAHAALLDNPEQLAYLAARGLPRKAVERYRLGWVPEDFFRERAAWGLPEERHPDGRAKKLWIPKGIVIPWFSPRSLSGAEVHRIRIRKATLRNAKDARYYWLPGSGNDIICLNPDAPAHVIVESDLDGLLIDWLAGDICATVPLGSCSTHPKATALASLEKSLRILVALDFDKPRWDEDKQQWIAPGAKAALWWSDKFSRAFKRWPVPDGKDPGEAFAAGVDLRAWVVAGLPPALQVKATTPQPPPESGGGVDVAVNSTPPSLGGAGGGEVFKIITAADGREFILTDDPATYRRMVNAGRICFTSEEMRHIIRCVDTPEQAARFLDIKTVFPGIKITESEDLRSAA